MVAVGALVVEGTIVAEAIGLVGIVSTEFVTPGAVVVAEGELQFSKGSPPEPQADTSGRITLATLRELHLVDRYRRGFPFNFSWNWLISPHFFGWVETADHNPCSQQCAVARSSRPRPTLATSCGWSKPDRSPCSQQCAVGPQSVSAFCSTHICCRGSGSPHGCNERLTAPRPTGAFDQSVQLQGGAYFFIPLGKLGGVFGIAGEMRRVTFPVATRAQGFVVDSLRQALLAWMTVSSGNVTNHRFSATPRR